MRFSLRSVTPNWFASVMGTGIVANAATGLPLQIPGQRAFALVVWIVAAALLVFLLIAAAVAAFRSPAAARSHHLDPVMAHFYGAPPMALLTVGAGALLVGRDVIGLPAAVIVDAVLWSAGTVTGLLSAVVVPYIAFTRHRNDADAAFGGWLMPIVPPMVSAATGALLVPYAPAGQLREDLAAGCLAMFGLSLIASLVVITQLWSRLAHHGVGSERMVPTLWIVLGPLGQSITAIRLLSRNSSGALGASVDGALPTVAVLFGLPVLGFALLWIGVAALVTVRAALRGLPFSLTWWSFTFPVGTCVTGTTGLAIATGSTAIAALSVVLFCGLLFAWGAAAVRTVRAQLPERSIPALAPSR
ncbi:TDT family transporter [Pseudolysinimonas sp.]|uniref:TDT family transporter n=1 Tax=Pseudolysinimonas sp. TaxID=2680009 RepID=UPI003F80DC88